MILDPLVTSDERRLEVRVDVGDADAGELALLVDAADDGAAAADHFPADAVGLPIPEVIQFNF